MPRKARIVFSVEQRLEYAKLMVKEGYTNKQVMEISGAGDTAVSRWKKQYLGELNGQTPSGKKVLTIGTGNIYGRRRMHVALLQKGFKLGIHKTASLMTKA